MAGRKAKIRYVRDTRVNKYCRYGITIAVFFVIFTEKIIKHKRKKGELK